MGVGSGVNQAGESRRAGARRHGVRSTLRRLAGATCLVVLCAWSSLAAAAPSAPSTTTVQAELLPLLDEMLAAANAHHTDRFMRMYARQPDTVLVFDDITLRGWQAIRDAQLDWWDHGKSDAVYRAPSPPQITPISADVVATLQTLEVTSTTPAGAKADARLFATSIWKRLPEGWRIVLAHESLLMAPATP